MESRSEKSDPGRELARISHELSATAPDPSASATARSSRRARSGAFLAPDQARAPRRTIKYASGALRARAVALTASPTLRDENP